MRSLNNSALARLQEAVDSPDLEGTRYRLIAKLGQGGMGSVYQVEDRTLARDVALKVINLADGRNEVAARLLQEAQVIARLEHPGIIPVHDAGALADGRPYYTMKLVQGKRLEDYVREVDVVSDRLRIFLRICDPVAFAHARGVLHRDLKPANVMVGLFGEVLVMDWGLSKLLTSGAIGSDGAAKPADPSLPDKCSAPGTDHGSVLGTLGYMSPEQASGGGQLDPRADIYSLGAILEFLLGTAGSGRVPRALSAICEKAMAAERNDRYSSVPDLAADVAHFLDGLPVTAYPESAFARAWRWITRNRTWLLLLLAYVVTRALLIFFRPR